LAIGKMLGAASEAADLLEAENISAAVWDVRVVKPLDPVMLADAAGYEVVITVEDGISEGGAGAGIVNALAAEAKGAMPLTRTLGVPLSYLPHGKADAILAACGLDAAGIAAAARSALSSLKEQLVPQVA